MMSKWWQIYFFFYRVWRLCLSTCMQCMFSKLWVIGHSLILFDRNFNAPPKKSNYANNLMHHVVPTTLVLLVSYKLLEWLDLGRCRLTRLFTQIWHARNRHHFFCLYEETACEHSSYEIKIVFGEFLTRGSWCACTICISFKSCFESLFVNPEKALKSSPPTWRTGLSWVSVDPWPRTKTPLVLGPKTCNRNIHSDQYCTFYESSTFPKSLDSACE